MARTLKDDEERLRRIMLIGEYMYVTGSSTRKTAKYFTENYFEISNYTVSQYLKLYSEMNPDKKNKIKEMIEERTVTSLDDENVKNRVLKVADLVLEGYTLEEIAKTMAAENEIEEMYWTVYRDIHNRLAKLDIDKYNQIKVILKERSLDNLNDKNK